MHEYPLPQLKCLVVEAMIKLKRLSHLVSKSTFQSGAPYRTAL